MPTDENEPWWAKIGTWLLGQPGGIAIIFSFILLGMLMGILPSTLSSTIYAVNTKVDNISATMTIEHTGIRQQIGDAVTAAAAKGETDTKLLRGICLIMAKDRNEQISYCNP